LLFIRMTAPLQISSISKLKPSNIELYLVLMIMVKASFSVTTVIPVSLSPYLPRWQF